MKDKLSKVTISNHAKQRYAERIMDKEETIEVNIFIARNEDKIKNDILKMIEFGEIIYEGISLNENNKKNTLVCLNGSWIILIDATSYNVITLYKIDLGLDENFNKEYVSKMVEKLNKEKENLLEVDKKLEEQSAIYNKEIAENELSIKEYSKIIDSLKEQNDAYEELISTLKTNHIIADKKVREVVASLIGRRNF